MKIFPETENALVVRTDFSDDATWESICADTRRPRIFGLRATVDFVSDPEYDGLDPEQLPSLVSDGSNHTFIFIVDRTTHVHPDHPILVVDLYTEPGRVFRVIPAEMWSVENNLSIANMDFEEFAEAVDPDGIFRGFPKG